MEFAKRLEQRKKNDEQNKKMIEEQKAMEMLRPMSGNNPVLAMDGGVEDSVFLSK